MADQTRDQVNLLSLLAFLSHWRRFILTAAFSVAIITAVISLIVPPIYKSTAVVRNQQTQEMGIGTLISGKLGGLGGLGALAGMSQIFGEKPEEVAVAILQSRWMSERVISKFDLRTVYKIKKAPIEDVIKELHANTTFTVDDGANNISIVVEDKSAQRAREMADYYVEQLDLRNQELRSQKARQERDFVGQRLSDEQLRLRQKEDSLFQFQTETGVLDIEEQVKATIQTAAAMAAERLKTKAELELCEKIYGPAGSETGFAKIRLASIDSTIQSLIRSDEMAEKDFLIPMQSIPEEGRTYLRLMRDIEIQQMLVGFILQQYEQSKIEEQRNTPTIVRVDPPYEATKRSWPKRSVMVLMAFTITFIFSSMIAKLIDYFTKASRDPMHAQHGNVAAIRQAWSKKH
ncbi:hypothetical protein HZB60_06310 [candidate division KSB1 bacterium]|nr:hypothetical protein [candidate division KSB1 bacterium]